MRFYLLFLLVCKSLFVSGQSFQISRYSDPKIFEIIETGKNNEVLFVYDGLDTLASINSKSWRNKGFPQFHLYDYNGDWYTMALPNVNRYLAVWGKKYCVVDSLLNIVIDFSDTIVGFGNYELCAQGDQMMPYTNNEVSVFFYYEAIRDGQTFLYDNRGTSLFSHSFNGLLMYTKGIKQCADNIPDRLSYQNRCFYTVDSRDRRKFGLIDSNGYELIPFGRYRTSWPSDSKHRFVGCYPVSAQSGIVTVLYDLKHMRFTKPSDGPNHLMFEFNNFPLLAKTFEIENERKKGLYHPRYGTIFPAEYDVIVELTPSNCRYYHLPEKENKNCLLLIKGNKHKIWKVPEKYRADY